jgi:hypothetical protein
MNKVYSKFEMSTISKLLKSRLASSPMNNAIRFEKQNLTWNYQELDVTTLI